MRRLRRRGALAGHPNIEGCRDVKKTKTALKVSTTIQADTPSELLAANNEHQVAAALAPDPGHHQHDRENVHGSRGPPPALLSKRDVCAITGLTFPTIWLWMREGRFPPGLKVGGLTKWRTEEIDAWIAALQPRKYAPVDNAVA
jgi:predicted DNA-binding transcriptional regulator AlpA